MTFSSVSSTLFVLSSFFYIFNKGIHKTYSFFISNIQNKIHELEGTPTNKPSSNNTKVEKLNKRIKELEQTNFEINELNEAFEAGIKP